MLEALSNNYEIDLILYQNNETAGLSFPYANLVLIGKRKKLAISLWVSFSKLIPLSIARYADSRITDYLDKRYSQYSVIFIDHLHPSYPLSRSKYFKDKKVKKIIFEHNLEYKVWEEYSRGKNLLARFFALIQSFIMKKYETKSLAFYDTVFFISNVEMKIMEKSIKSALEMCLMPISPFSFIDNNSILKDKDEDMLLFVGSFSWYPNISAIDWFLDKCWPLIMKNRPSTKLLLVGSGSDKYIKSKKHFYRNVEATGFVDKVSPFYERASLFILPMQTGAGIKIKLLEAISYGMPIISTKKGIEGISEIVDDNKDGANFYMLAETPEEFSTKIAYILNNKILLKEISKSGSCVLKRREQEFLATVRNI
jgi:glycosyltransferase involved in cell wall biosynthesis